MCEMFRPPVLSKCTTTEHKALKDCFGWRMFMDSFHGEKDKIKMTKEGID